MKTAPQSALPRGFRFGAVNCGLRVAPKLDLGLILPDGPVAAAGVFTSNLVKAPPVILCQQHLRRAGSRIRAVIVNSRNANCATGPAGMKASVATARRLARAVGCVPEQVMVCSTGVIGVPLPVERIVKAVPKLMKSAARRTDTFGAFTRAIMTTDTVPKWAAARCRIGGRTVRLLGCAKGAGMIHPHMATTLSYVVTDAAITPALLRKALATVVATTFNAISVDGDTSTNDTLLVLAGSGAGHRAVTRPGRDYRAFVDALHKICRSLALQVVSDGEGASRVIEIEVRGAPSDAAAARVAGTIATSPLVKTMFAGADPNWGRILAAAGRAGVHFDPGRTDVYLAGLLACRRGAARNPFNERRAHRRMLRDFVPVVVDLKCGRGRARVWTCDFTTEYVHINASYRT